MKLSHWLLPLFFIACAPELPATYTVLGGPEDFRDYVEVAIDGWRETGLWDPIYTDISSKDAARFMWVLNYSELQGLASSGTEQSGDIWISPENWAINGDGARISLLRHEIGHLCIEGHKSTGLMRSHLQFHWDDPALAVDAVAQRAFRGGCGLH